MAFKPSNEEQKWAKQQELDWKKELRKHLPQESLDKMQKLCLGKCPKDGTDLIPLEIDNTDIIIKKCASCAGIWIDRKNLTKFLQSSQKSQNLLRLLSKTLGIEVPKSK